jgi:hypothetical protein
MTTRPRWINRAAENFPRVPTVISGLLLVWSPLILRLDTAYHAVSGLSDQRFLPRWLTVTAALFTISAATLAVRAIRGQRGVP